MNGGHKRKEVEEPSQEVKPKRKKTKKRKVSGESDDAQLAGRDIQIFSGQSEAHLENDTAGPSGQQPAAAHGKSRDPFEVREGCCLANRTQNNLKYAF